jgi:hypothetical protein
VGVTDSLRKWHEKLSEALWAHRTSRHGATNVTPFELVYGQEAVLPVDVSLQNLLGKEYTELMMDKVDEARESWLKALDKWRRRR